MAAGFEFFKSTDVGAPVLTGVAGEGITLLDWITVGKGGWTKTFTGTRLATYRADTGNRFTLRVNNVDPYFLLVRAYQSMTAVSTGTGMFPAIAQYAADTTGIPLIYMAGTPVRYWGVRTNRWFTLIIEFGNDGSKARYNFTFGDVPSLCEADGFNTVLTFSPDPYFKTQTYGSSFSFIANAVNGPFHPLGGGAGWVAAAGSPNGSVVSPIACLNAPYGALTITDSDATVFSNSGRLNYSGFMVSTDVSVLEGNRRYPRVMLPNIQQIANPVGSSSNSAFAVYDEEVITLGAKTFLVLKDRASSAAGFMLETTDTDGAL